jgi:hypothetical protein
MMKRMFGGLILLWDDVVSPGSCFKDVGQL